MHNSSAGLAKPLISLSFVVIVSLLSLLGLAKALVSLHFAVAVFLVVVVKFNKDTNLSLSLFVVVVFLVVAVVVFLMQKKECNQMYS